MNQFEEARMTDQFSTEAKAFLGCVPHAPFMMLQDRQLNQPFWDAYEAQAKALRAFDPELVFVFGADHYSGQHMRLMPSFAIGQAAEAIDDDGGYPGKLDVPFDLSLACATHVIEAGIDIGTSFAMEVDHGFSAVIGNFLGAIDAKPVIPVFVNALAAPRPTFRRCRMLGEAIGEFAAGLGKRVAFLGSGGLSHETGDVFPQYIEASDPRTRDYILHGGASGGLDRQTWLDEMHDGLQIVNGLLLDRVPGVGEIRPDWDDNFLRLFAAGDLTVFDDWKDADVVRTGGNGAGEVRQWIAAAAAAQKAGAGAISVDFYQHDLPMGVASVVVHA
jgi:2,3-dihydroxyphenylpropionate 1,2-dioxygenase